MSRRGAPPPPSSEAPVSKEILAIVKKKISAPAGPPPAGLTNFKAPRALQRDHDRERSSRNSYSVDDSYDEDESFDYGSPVGKQSSGRDILRAGSKQSSAPKRFEGDDDDEDIDKDDDRQGSTLDRSKAEPKDSTTVTDGSKDSSKSVTTTGKTLVFNFAPILKATYRELKHFVSSPCEPGYIVRCYIERNRSGSNMLAPFYSLCADLEDGTGRELLVCKKIFQSRSSHYVFSLKSDDLYRNREQRSRLYLGKLRGVSANEYVLYDDGICDNPGGGVDDDDLDDATYTTATSSSVEAKKAGGSAKGTSGESSLYRKELAVIYFNTKSRPAPTGVRGLEVCIPYTDCEDDGSSAKITGSIQMPFDRIRQAGKQNEMYNKRLYDPLSSCLVDFRGRANIASVKNFQLVESHPAGGAAASSSLRPSTMVPEGEKEFLLQMGKTTEDCFNMDFKHPLSLLQAFAACIARFDAKLTW